MIPNVRTALLVIALLALPVSLWAQGTEVALSGWQQDSGLPVEIAADQLKVDQSTGIAVFSGDVVIAQGGMKLSAAEVQVEYVKGAAGAAGKIKRLLAKGHVLLVTPTEAAEAEDAIYDVELGELTMTGNVVLTQGGSALSGQRLVVNLTDGTAVVEGRVTTTLQTSTSP